MVVRAWYSSWGCKSASCATYALGGSGPSEDSDVFDGFEVFDGLEVLDGLKVLKGLARCLTVLKCLTISSCLTVWRYLTVLIEVSDQLLPNGVADPLGITRALRRDCKKAQSSKALFGDHYGVSRPLCHFLS